MARLGMKAAAFSYVGRDDWADRHPPRLEAEGVDCGRLLTHPTAATSTTAVLIDPSGAAELRPLRRAPKLMDKPLLLGNLDLFARSRMMLIGYYSLMPNLEPDLPEIFAEVRRDGCRTALDRPAKGARWSRSDRILPQL